MTKKTSSALQAIVTIHTDKDMIPIFENNNVDVSSLTEITHEDLVPMRHAAKKRARSDVSPIRRGLYNMYEECLISCI